MPKPIKVSDEALGYAVALLSDHAEETPADTRRDLLAFAKWLQKVADAPYPEMRLSADEGKQAKVKE
jgi:hypothetical protein